MLDLEIDRAIHDKIVIEPIERPTQSGGVYLLDLGNEQPEIGKVVYVGPGTQYHGVANIVGDFVETQVKVGDIVAIPRIGSFVLEVDNKKYFVTREIEILAVLKYKNA